MKTIQNLIKDLGDYRDGVPLIHEDRDTIDWIIYQLKSVNLTKILLEQDLIEPQKSEGIMTNIKDIIQDIKNFGLEAPLIKCDSIKIDVIVDKLMEIKPIRVLINHELTDPQKLELIDLFHDWYCNTNQDTEDFSKEFYYVVEDILHGCIPVKLIYLDDYQDLLVEACPYLESKILKAMSLEIKQED